MLTATQAARRTAQAERFAARQARHEAKERARVERAHDRWWVKSELPRHMKEIYKLIEEETRAGKRRAGYFINEGLSYEHVDRIKKLLLKRKFKVETDRRTVQVDYGDFSAPCVEWETHIHFIITW